MQNHIRPSNCRPRALNADFLDHIVGVAQACGIDDVQRHTFDLHGLCHRIARCACDRCDNRHILPSQCIQQRRLTDIRLPHQHHMDTFAQQCPLFRGQQHTRQLRLDSIQLTKGIGFLQEIDFLFRKIQGGLDQHAQVHDAIHQSTNSRRKFARQRPHRAFRCGLRRGFDQIGHRFRLCQINFVIQKCALCELTRLGQTHAMRLTRLHATAQQQLHDHRAAVALQLKHMLACVGMRRIEIQGQSVVNRRAQFIQKRPVMRMARREHPPTYGVHQGLNGIKATRCTHHAHTASPRSSGNGDNGGSGVGVCCHGGIHKI